MTSGHDKKLFFFGYGYVADHLRRFLQSQDDGWRFGATTRDPMKRKRLKDMGMKAYIFDDSKAIIDPIFVLNEYTHILISIPPKSDGDLVFNAHIDDIMQLKSLDWIGYLSATSVYGNRDGERVTEEDEVKPSSQRGSRRWKAEEQWRRYVRMYQIPAHVFRIAGVYGPYRNALDGVRAGIAKRIHKPGHAFNRVHIEDVVQVLVASMKSPSIGSVYNVADDNPAESQEVNGYAANLLGFDPPPLVPFEEANLPPMARSFYSDNKIIDNTKIKEELGVQLLYPDYRSGLQACLDAEDSDSLFA